MRYRLDQLNSNTEFEVHGRMYQQGSICGPVYCSRYSGQWMSWDENVTEAENLTPRDEHGKVQKHVPGVVCHPKMGGMFQNSKECAVWFPVSDKVEVSYS